MRILRRSEALPTDSSAAAADPLLRLTRDQKKALRASRMKEHKAKKRLIEEAAKTQLLSRFRTALAGAAAPTRRGKERVAPKAKKLSVLKRGIVTDRQVRRTLRQLAETEEPKERAVTTVVS